MSHKKNFRRKRGIFDVESPKIFKMKLNLFFPNIQSVKVFNIYDIFFGLDELEFEKVVKNTFVDQWWIFCIMKILQNPFICNRISSWAI